MLVTTEEQGQGQELARQPLYWFSAENGHAPNRRPLVVASGENCAFRPAIIRNLEALDWPYEFYPDLQDDEVVSVLVKADLAVTVALKDSNLAEGLARVKGASLPQLPDFGIYLYKNEAATSLALNDLAALAAQVYGA